MAPATHVAVANAVLASELVRTLTSILRILGVHGVRELAFAKFAKGADERSRFRRRINDI